MKTTETWLVPVCPGCFEDMELDPEGKQRMVQTWLSEETMDFDKAQEWAKEQGGRCLTKEEIHLLIACGLLKEGDKPFWASSVYSNDRDNAWAFNGYNGYVYDFIRSNSYYVRCVGRVEDK